MEIIFQGNRAVYTEECPRRCCEVQNPRILCLSNLDTVKSRVEWECQVCSSKRICKANPVFPRIDVHGWAVAQMSRQRHRRQPSPSSETSSETIWGDKAT